MDILLRMKLFLIILVFSVCTINAQEPFRLNDASKQFDVELKIENCPPNTFELCGPLTVRFFSKNRRRSFQTLRLLKTEVWDRVPKANVTRLYDEQSAINVGDFNFDGKDDIAICDGDDGGYHMPSYRVYLYSRSRKRFEYSRAFTRMNDGGLGMFRTERAKKRHFVFTKSSCCWHQTRGYDVFRGRPRKVYQLTEALRPGSPDIFEITTEKLIRGKWRMWVKRVEVSAD
jgi:hypothetical protein